MITVKGRELVIPESERMIGTTYDNNSENRQFKIDRVTTGGVDLSGLSFRLDLEYQGEQVDTSLLTVETGDKSLILTWLIAESCVQKEGTVWAAIRAYDENGTVKWATLKGAFYVGSTIDTPGSYTGKLTELEQLEARIDAKTEALDTGEAERQKAEAERKASEEARQLNEIARQQASNAAVSRAQEATGQAEAAAQDASAIAKDLTSRLESGELKGKKGDTGPAGPKGESGIMAPSSGMFSLYLDPETGNLYAEYPDGETPPRFEYEAGTGNLYYVIDEEGS